MDTRAVWLNHGAVSSMTILIMIATIALLLALPISEAKRDQADSMLKIFIVPHSHDDVGWMETIDRYYEGQVKAIYNTVTESLASNPARKFSIVEQAYFSRWYKGATETQRQQIRTAIQNGQAEFVEAGWDMNDDAISSYDADINQMTVGHGFIYETFGVRPRVGWHIDPFGQSSLTARLYSKMGFLAHVINRIAYNTKWDWMNAKKLQFMWQDQSHAPQYADAQIFTHALDQQGYQTIPGFMFDRGDEPVTPDNIHELSSTLVYDAKERSKFFRMDGINSFMWLYGDDFTFTNAVINYNNMDQLVAYINNNSHTFNAVAQYATVGDYFAELYKANIPDWRSYDNDFFPYPTNQTFWRAHGWTNENGHGYWAGFFTSRPALKGYARSRAAFLRTTELLYTSASVLGDWSASKKAELYARVDTLRKANAELQHHDAVTGTMKAPVVYDMYMNDLRNATIVAEPVVFEAMQTLIAKDPQGPSPSFSLNESLFIALPLTSSFADKPVIVYNPLAWQRTEIIRLKVNRPDLIVVDRNGTKVRMQINEWPQGIANQSSPYSSEEDQQFYELFFEAKNLPPLGYSTFFLSSGANQDMGKTVEIFRLGQKQAIPIGSGETYSIQNPFLKMQFSPANGLLTGVSFISGSRITGQFPFHQNLMEYDSYSDWRNGQTSGAYIFNPVGPAQPILSQSQKMQSMKIVRGPLVQEVVQVFDATHAQIFRIYNSSEPTVGNFIQVVHEVGPMKMDKEFITRYSTAIQSKQLLITDANGLEMRPRVFRPNVSHPIPGNYFPMTAFCFMRDTQMQFSILSARSHGVASLRNGEVEVMMHRKPSRTDGEGPPDNNDDSVLQDVELRLVIGPIYESNRLRHVQSLLLQFPPQILIGDTEGKFKGRNDWLTHFNSDWTLLPAGQEFPRNIHLLSLDATSPGRNPVGGSTLLRLVHLYERGEDTDYSEPTGINLEYAFPYFKFNQLTETSLTGVYRKEDMPHYQWHTARTAEDNKRNTLQPQHNEKRQEETEVMLQPLDITTLVTTLDKIRR